MGFVSIISGLFSSAGKPYKRSSTSLHSDAEDSADSGFLSDRGALNNSLSTSSLRKTPTAHGDLQSYRQLSPEGNMTACEEKDGTTRKSSGGTAWLPGSSIASVALPESKVLEPSAGPAGDIIERSRNVLTTAHKPTAHRRWNSTESATPQPDASTRQPYPTGLKGFFSRPIKLTQNEINLLSIQK